MASSCSFLGSHKLSAPRRHHRRATATTTLQPRAAFGGDGKKKLKVDEGIGGAVGGAVLGGLLLGPFGAILGGQFGARLGSDSKQARQQDAALRRKGITPEVSKRMFLLFLFSPLLLRTPRRPSPPPTASISASAFIFTSTLTRHQQMKEEHRRHPLSLFSLSLETQLIS